MAEPRVFSLDQVFGAPQGAPKTFPLEDVMKGEAAPQPKQFALDDVFRAPTYESRSLLEKRVTDRAERGWELFKQGSLSALGSANVGRQTTLDPYFARLDKGEEYSAVVPTDVQGKPSVPLSQTELNLLREYAGGDESARAELKQGYLESAGQTFAAAGKAGAAAERIPVNPEIGNFAAAIDKGEYLEAAKTLVTNPSIITDLGVESLPQMAPALALATLNPALGAAAMGGSSAAQEYGSSLIDQLAKAGVDTTSPDAIIAALKDPKIAEPAKAFASQRAGMVGVFDAAAGLLGAKALIPSKLVTNPVRQEALNVLVAQPAAQMALGGGGEAMAQLASEGQVSSPGAVALEMVGELATAPVEAGAFGTQRYLAPSPDSTDAPLSIGEIERRLRAAEETQRQAEQAASETEQRAEQGTAEGQVEAKEPATPEEPTAETPEGAKAPPAQEQQTLDSLPQDWKKVKVAEGVSKEAQSLAQSAIIKRNVAEKYKAEGQVEAALKMRRAAELNWEQAQKLGFRLEVVQKRGKKTPEAAQPQAEGAPQTQVIPPARQPETLFGAPLGSETSQMGETRRYALRPEAVPGKNVEARQNAGLIAYEVSSDLAWADLRDEVQQMFPNKDLTPENIKTWLQSKGYDALRISWDETSKTNYDNKSGYEIAEIKRRFKVPQVLVYDNAIEVLHRTFDKSSPIKQDKPFYNLRANSLKWLERIFPGHAQSQGAGVHLYGEAVEGLAEANKVLDFVREVAKRFFPGARIILDLRSARQGSWLAKHGEQTNALANFIGFQDGTMAIWVNPDAFSSGFQSVQALAHELGHAVAFWNFYNQDSAMQQMIYDDYQRFLVRSGKQTPVESMIETLNAMTIATLGQNVEDGQLILDGQATDANIARMRRWFDFDEWMAEQFVRWATTETRKPFTLVEKFFKDVGMQIRNVFRMFGLDVSKSVASETMTQWFVSLQEKHAKGGISSIPFAVMHSQIVGQEKVAKALGEELEVDGPAPSPASLPFWTAGNKLGIKPATSASIDKFNWWVGKMWGLLQIADKNKHIVGLQNFVEAVRGFHIAKMSLVSRADQRLRDWRRLGKEMATNLSEFLYAIDRMEYLKPGENGRWPTQQELAALAQKYKLNAEALDLYVKVKDDFADVLNRMEQAWVTDATRSITDPQRLQKAVREIRLEMTRMRAKPYFPHERFGEWTVAVRDAKGKTIFFQQFATKKQALNAERSLRAQAQVGQEVTSGRLPQEIYQFRGLPPGLMQRVAANLNLNAAQRRMLEDLILDLSPANSAAKRFKRRENTPGFSLDAQRSYAAYFLSMSGHIARLEYNQVMSDAIRDVQGSARAMRGAYIAEAVDRRMGIAEWMQRSFDYLNDSKSEWQGLRAFAFLWYLGYNVSSAVVNLTQVPLVTYPYLAARFGDLATGNQLRRAYSDVRGTYLMRKGAFPQELEDALTEAIAQGFIDESMATELAAAAEGGNLSRILAGTAIQRGLQGVANVGAVPFQLIEKLNRRVTFIAAFRMAQKGTNIAYLQELRAANPELYATLLAKGWTQQNAEAFLAGRDAVDRTQFEYAKWARPEFMRGKKGVIFTFFMFKQNMLWFLKNSPGAGRAWLMMLAGAGIMGLPGAEDLEDFIRFASRQLFGKDFSPEQEFRRLMVEELQMNPDLVMHGLGHETLGLSWVGDALGIPVPGVDISSRIGMGRVVPGVQALFQQAQSFDQRLGKLTQEVGGAALNIPLSILEAMNSNQPDIFKTIERALPTAARNLAAAYRWIDEGAEKDSRGAELVEFDVTDTKARLEILAKAMGFNPTRVSQARAKAQAQRDVAIYWIGRRQELFTQFAAAKMAGDKEAVADVREAIKAYNAEAPDRNLKVTLQDLRNSLQQRLKRNKRVEAGVGPQKMTQGLYREVEQLYPSGPVPPTE